jgi:hypothetical protein
MRTIILVVAALVALPLTSLSARADGAWCACYSSSCCTNCGFHAVMYLEKSAFVTGEILHVDGGASAGRW